MNFKRQELMSMQIEDFQKAADLKGLIIRVLQKLRILLLQLTSWIGDKLQGINCHLV